jgi:FMN phosphatase YigB (HAD superfamily)
MTVPGWVSFDCYGTLVDWNRGITATMEARPPAAALSCAASNREGDDSDPSLATAVIPDLSTLPEVVAALLRD